MWNPPLIILSAFHWLSENSNLGYFSCIICQHWNVNIAVYSKFMLVNLNTYKASNTQGIPWNSKYPGFCWKCAKTQQLLRVTLGYPEYSHLCSWNTKIISQKYPRFWKPRVYPWLPWVIICDIFNGGFHQGTTSSSWRSRHDTANGYGLNSNYFV